MKDRDKIMEELFEMIEKMIKEAGYPGEVNGQEFYMDVEKEAEDKENGTYIFMVKKDGDVFYEGCMDIMDTEFDLHYVDIHDGETVYHVNFDI